MIDIFSVEINDGFNTIPAANLRGCISSYVKATIKFYMHWEVINQEMRFTDSKQIQLTNGGWLKANFLPGDTIFLTGSGTNNGTYGVVSVDDKFLLTDRATNFTPEVVKGSAYGINGASAIKFAYGLPENSQADNFYTRLDSVSKQEYFLQNGDPFMDSAPYDLLRLHAKKHWLSGKPSEQTPVLTKFPSAAGIGYGKEFYYQIEHIFYITPAITEDWLDANGMLKQDSNELYANEKSPRYCFRVELATDNQNFRFNTDNSNIKSYELQGAVGWYGEEGNGLPAKFSIDSLSYKDDVSGDAVSSIISNGITRVEFSLKCTAPAAFTNDAAQKANVFFSEKPTKAVYTNPNNDLFTNYNYSIANIAIGSAVNFGQITNSALTYVSPTELKVTFKYTGTGREFPYALWVETQSGGITDLKLSDKAAILINEATPMKLLNISNVVTSKLRLLEHPFTEYADATTDYKGWIEDGVLAQSEISALKQNETGDVTELKSVKVNIVAENNDGRMFSLETMTLLVGTDTVRDFKLASGDAKLSVSLIEKGDLETPSAKYYTLKYGFKLRFEDWLNQPNADPDFIGKDTKNWANYSMVGDWNLKIYLDHNIQVGTQGADVYRLKGNLYAIRYEEFDACEAGGMIETFKNSDMTPLAGVSSPMLSIEDDTYIKATYTGNGLNCYSYDNTTFYGILEFYELAAGTTSDIRQISTEFDPETDTPWIGPVTSKARLVKNASPDYTVIVDAILKKSAVNKAKSYTISGRLGKIMPIQIETCTCIVGYTYDIDNGNCYKLVYGQIGDDQYKKMYTASNAGFDFTVLDENGDPTPIDGENMMSQRNAISIFDSAGNPVFYTNGVEFYDSTNTLVTNLLKGGTSSYGMAAIPKPGDLTKYLIFTVPNPGVADKVYKSEYNTITKLFTPGIFNIAVTTEDVNPQISIAHGSNAIWLICHEFYPSNKYIIIKIDAITAAITYTTYLSPITQTSPYGEIKYNGRGKFAQCLFLQELTLFDFDTTTGIISNHIILDPAIEPWEGCDFSPSGLVLYAGTAPSPAAGKLYQYDMQAGSILASRFFAFSPTIPGSNLSVNGINLLVNNKVAVCTGAVKNAITIINFPDKLGAACNIVEDQLPMFGGETVFQGLGTTDRYYSNPIRIEYPCSCQCDEGFTFDPVNDNCFKIAGEGDDPVVGKNGNNWSFGNQAGLNFNALTLAGDPVPRTDFLLQSNEGCTTISDDSGNLLFYTNGISLWDANHVLKANDLMGSPTSDESSIVTRVPGTLNDYYLYTISDLGLKKNLRYNRLRNVTTAGLILNITEKNLPLYPDPAIATDIVTESLQVFKNIDGSYWIITAKTTGEVVSVKLKTDGTFSAPIINSTTYSGNVAGQLRINTQGTLLAKARFGANLRLYNFDSNTGISTDFGLLSFLGSLSYGVEFSPDGKYLYVSSVGNASVYRYDLSSMVLATIQASQTLIGSTTFPGKTMKGGKVQLGPNGRIYYALSVTSDYQTFTEGPNFIAVIEDPNSITPTYRDDVALNSNPRGVYLETSAKTSRLSLPSFDVSIVTPSTIITVPCKNTIEGCSLPDVTIEPSCPGAARITMTTTKGRTWIVTDDQGTSPVNISSNDTYFFGTYANIAVQITLTDSIRPDCKITQSIIIDCIPS